MPKYVVRYGAMRHLGVFSSRGRDRYARGQRVIARTGRGQESGEVLVEATEHVLSQMGEKPYTGQILRLETSDDTIELRRLGEQERSEYDVCRDRIAESGLDMKLVDVERLYGGERVVVYYLAEQRVDFRELVKVLARELQTRVEMRQIGVRDEAKLLADYGDCGKPVCCNTHLPEMPPVSMKMAKLQRATLDPNKISGRCGRLKCCLRYEYDTYQELQKELPKVGSAIVTRDGQARVLSQEILTSELLVETEDGRRVVIQSSDVLTVLGKAPKPERANGPDRSKGSDRSQGESRDAKPRRGSRDEDAKTDSGVPGDKSDADPAEGGAADPGAKKSRRSRPRRDRRRRGDGPKQSEAPGGEATPEGDRAGEPQRDGNPTEPPQPPDQPPSGDEPATG